jgi:uncharacterized membrane protein
MEVEYQVRLPGLCNAQSAMQMGSPTVAQPPQTLTGIYCIIY